MSRVARDAGTVAAITMAARVVGFLRWIVFAWAVGAAGVGTVYQSVNTVPNIVYEIAVGGILAAVVVPLVAGRIAAEGGEHPDEVASALLRGDEIFRDAAHHFLRHFDILLTRLLPQLDDAEIEVLAESRSARAFMLVGRGAGIFG